MNRAGLQSRIALGLSPTPRPGLILLPVGMALGPAGLNVLSDTVLSYLDPVVAIALAALGVFAGLDLNFRRVRETALFAAATVEAGLTMVAVGAGLWLIRSRLDLSAFSLWQVLTMFAVAAAVSSTASGDQVDRPSSFAARVGDLDDVVPIFLSGLLLAWLHQGFSRDALSLVSQTTLIALIIAAAGWLLVGQVLPEGEQQVFVAGTLLLLGGAAAFLSMSSLWVGLVAGLFWGVAGGSARDSIERDMRYLQRPLIVLLLLVTGARLELSLPALGVGVVYVLFRSFGKLAGGWAAGRIILPELPRDVGRRLLAPGVLAVASAVNVLQATGTSNTTTLLLAVTVIGSLGSELLAVMVQRQRES
ncbi:MAG TPA: hypothetical protein VM818_23895 [Vicinamibacterales bacterium]|nr:hypothetical protein [Vicinamibacterales bacterium]